MRPTRIPQANSDWHPRAKALYASLKTSGQSDYYQNSDWQMAQIACDLLSHCYLMTLNDGTPAPFYKCTMLIAEINEILKQLGVTEGARRQTMRVELSEPVIESQSDEDAAIDAVAAMLNRGAGG